MMKKRIMSLILMVVMMTGILPQIAFAETSGTCGDTLAWTLDDSGTLIISGTGEMTDYNSSSAPWKNSRSAIKTIVIDDGVTSISDYAFYYCKNLTNITIPDSVTKIGYGAFYNCSSITSIIIPEGVTTIDSSAFYDCSKLTSITIPDSVTSIGSGAFYDCINLTSISIPVGVTSIAEDTFFGCSSLKSIVIPDSIISIDMYAFSYCYALTSITIPDSVTSIGSYAFKNCVRLKQVIIPASVKSMGEHIFDGCTSLTSAGPIGGDYSYQFGWEKSIPANAFSYSAGLTSITIPEGITSIGNKAFMGCNSLTNITIPDSVTSIGDGAFNACSGLTSAGPIGGDYSYQFGWKETIPANAFINCSRLTDIIIPNSVTSIGNSAFKGCDRLTSITIPDSVTSIGESAFYDCGALTNIIIPNGVTAIGDKTFYQCSNLENIIIPDSVTSFGSFVFVRCTGLTSAGPIGGDYSYQFGWKETIPADAFSFCEGLTSVTIPDGITDIGSSAFWECSQLTDITIPDSVTSIKEGLFNDTAYYNDETNWENGILYIGKHLIKAKNVTGNCEIKEGTIVIADAAFSSCTDLTNIIIPNGVTCISSTAFYNCSNLTSITIPDSVTSIENWAFNRCTSLVNVEIPNGVTKIEYTTFANCSSLTSITIPNSVISIESGAFHNCDALTDVYYLGTEDEWNAIIVETDNTDLTSAIIHYNYNNTDIIANGTCGDNLTWVLDKDGTLTISGTGEMTVPLYTEFPWLTHSSSIKSLVIENGVTTIGNNAFASCGNLADVSIPDSIITIGNNAFINCSALTEVTIPANVENIGDWAFSNCYGMQNFTVSEQNECYKSIDGVLFNKSGTTLVHYPLGRVGGYTIPEGVTTIGFCAFLRCAGLTEITIPKSVTTIEFSNFGAFYDEDGNEYSVLTDIYYGGTEAEWNGIVIGDDNEGLNNAEIHYNSISETNPVFCITSASNGRAGEWYTFNVSLSEKPDSAFLQFDAPDNKFEWLSEEYCESKMTFEINTEELTLTDGKYAGAISLLIFSSGNPLDSYNRKVRICADFGSERKYSDAYSFIVEAVEEPTNDTSIGHLYEQTSEPSETTKAPQILSVVTKNNGNGKYSFTVEHFDAEDKNAVFFYWETDNGKFTSANDNFSTVELETNSQANVTLTMGDGYGYIDTKTIAVGK